MKYLINSNLYFSSKSLRILIPTMLDCGISPKDILVVIGGSSVNSEDFQEAGMYMCLNVKFNSIDQNCFYAMKKNEAIFRDDYYYYMHDTTKVGPKFKSSVEDFFHFFKAKNLNTMKNVRGCSGNMGFYKKDFILKTFSEDELYLKYEREMTDEDSPNQVDRLERKKTIGYDLEDRIFLKDCLLSGGHFYFVSEAPEFSSEKVDIYGTGNMRVVSHHDKIDLYKFGGNGFFSDGSPLNTSNGIKL